MPPILIKKVILDLDLFVFKSCSNLKPAYSQYLAIMDLLTNFPVGPEDIIMPLDDTTPLSYFDETQSFFGQTYLEPASISYNSYDKGAISNPPSYDKVHSNITHLFSGETAQSTTKHQDTAFQLSTTVRCPSDGDGNSGGDERSGLSSETGETPNTDHNLRRSQRNVNRHQKRDPSIELEYAAESHSTKHYQGTGPDKDDGKSLLRARNRTAAAKFRVRKKYDIGQLEETEAKLRRENRALHEEACQLRDETLRMKDMILNHAGCQCKNIDEYIQHAADSLSEGSRGSLSSQTSLTSQTSQTSQYSKSPEAIRVDNGLE